MKSVNIEHKINELPAFPIKYGTNWNKVVDYVREVVIKRNSSPYRICTILRMRGLQVAPFFSQISVEYIRKIEAMREHNCVIPAMRKKFWLQYLPLLDLITLYQILAIEDI